MCKVNCERRSTGGGGRGEGDKRRKRKALDIMLLCVDLVLRGKSLKWWKTTNSWHRGSMGPSSLPVRKWPTSAPSSLPPAADWQSWVPAAPLPWRTTTSTTTTMTASTTGVSVTACMRACGWMCALIRCLSVSVWGWEHEHVWVFWIWKYSGNVRRVD